MARAPDIRVEVVYALAREQILLEVSLPAGATVGDAIRASGICSRFPEIESDRMPVGIYGRRAQPADKLSDGDRVEIYRQLTVAPRIARLRRLSRSKG